MVNIVILTGAGISAESGLQTFRSIQGQTYWDIGHNVHRVEDVCTPDALEQAPEVVHRFYDDRRAALATVQPNAAHHALAQLDAQWPGNLLVVTQNVDDLHERAGATRLIHMHGELQSALCASCGDRGRWEGRLPPGTACGVCDSLSLRPDIVFFGEMPYRMGEIDGAIRECDLFVSIGTWGPVYPAAGFVQTARAAGAYTLEINLEPSLGTHYFAEARTGPAGVLVPEWVTNVLASLALKGFLADR